MTINEKQAFLIKGQRDGLLITLQEGDWKSITDDLLDHIRDRQAFFKGARVALDVGSRFLSIAEISGLRDRFSDFQVILWALQTSDERSRQSAKNLGLQTTIPSNRTEQKLKPFDTLIAGEEALLVSKTLRSGYRVVYEGHVIILGDVNPGAEIVAGGSVIVWGRLKGGVHAGAEGDETAVVCALEMKPTQIRIASTLSLSPQGRKSKSQPEIFAIRNGQLIAEIWKP